MKVVYELIHACDDCPYTDYRRINGGRFILGCAAHSDFKALPTDESLPDWCPLPDAKEPLND